MKAFDFDSHLTNRYASFSRSFTAVRAEDLSDVIEAEYSAGRFWPDSRRLVLEAWDCMEADGTFTALDLSPP